MEETNNTVEEIIDYKDKYLRQLAELENARKRMQKEKQEAVRYAMDNLLADFIAPLDSFEGALKCADGMSDEVKNWAMGFQMILTQFQDVLKGEGVEAFVSIGKLFDPHMHEAVEMEEREDVPEGTILQEYVKGYRCGERIIRPARVKVAKLKGESHGE
ncbi:MAG: nucleotide exchange factor GrpE [Verrucomicrobia bacterium]|nr:nucleotide exchange factor GrpE [Verrucomicrobiota bacterium]